MLAIKNMCLTFAKIYPLNLIFPSIASICTCDFLKLPIVKESGLTNLISPSLNTSVKRHTMYGMLDAFLLRTHSIRVSIQHPSVFSNVLLSSSSNRANRHVCKPAATYEDAKNAKPIHFGLLITSCD